MGNFLSLVQVEHQKLWKRLSTKIMPLILIAVVAGLIGLVRLESNMAGVNITTGTTGQTEGQSAFTDWRQTLEAENRSIQAEIDTAEKSTRQSGKTQLDASKATLAKNQYALDHNLRPANLNENGSYNNSSTNDFWNSVLRIGMSSIAALFAIIACTALVAGEFSEGTMKTALTRPFTRGQVLSAKLLVVVGYSVMVVAVSQLTALASTAAFFGTGGAWRTVLLWMGGRAVPLSGWAAFALVSGLELLTTLVYVCLTFALSAISRSRAVATGVSIFLMFAGSFTMFIAYNFSWGKLIFFADTAFSSFVLSGAPFYGITLGSALLICSAYSAAFLAAAYAAFIRRDVAG